MQVLLGGGARLKYAQIRVLLRKDGAHLAPDGAQGVKGDGYYEKEERDEERRDEEERVAYCKLGGEALSAVAEKLIAQLTKAICGAADFINIPLSGRGGGGGGSGCMAPASRCLMILLVMRFAAVFTAPPPTACTATAAVAACHHPVGMRVAPAAAVTKRDGGPECSCAVPRTVK